MGKHGLIIAKTEKEPDKEILETWVGILDIASTIAELNTKEKRASQTLGNISDAIITTDIHGSIAYMNSMAEKLTGKRFDNVKGLLVSDIISLEDEKGKKIKSHRILDFHCYHRTDNAVHLVSETGVRHAVVDKSSAITGDKGSIVGFTFVFQDVSLLKKREKEMHRNLKLLEAVIDTMPNPVFFKDEKGIYRNCNRAFAEQIIGLPKTEIIGKSLFDMPKAIPNDLAEIYHAQDLKLMKSGKLQVYEQKVQCRDKRRRDFIFNKTVFKNDAGDVRGIVGVMVDISDRKKAEEQLKNAHLELNQTFNAATPLCLIDLDYTIMRVNESFCALFDMERDEIEGKKCFELPTTSLCKTPACPMKKVLLGDDLYEYETEIVEKNGERKYVLATARPYKDSDGNITGIVESYLDITHRKYVEIEIEHRLGIENIVSEISSEFLRSPTDEIDNLIELSLGRVAEFDDVDRAYLFLLDNKRMTMTNTHEWCRSGVEPQKDNLIDIPFEAIPWWMNKLQSFDVIPLPILSALPKEATAEKLILEQQDIKSLLVVPMVLGDELIGFFGFDRVQLRKGWSEQDIALMRTLSGIFSSAIGKRNDEVSLKRSEEKYRNLFENSKDMVYITSFDGRIKEINRAGVDLLGWNKEEELIGKRISDCYVIPTIRSQYEEQIRHQGFVKDIEIPFMKRDGDIIYGLETSSSIVDKNGESHTIRGIIRDITERVKMEKILKQKTIELEKSNQTIRRTQATLIRQEKMASIGQLAAGVAHEINNPLGFVSSNHSSLSKYFMKLAEFAQKIEEMTEGQSKEQIEGLRKKYSIEFILEDIEDIFKESQEGFERIKSIVQNLKTFSRMDTGDEFEQLDINQAIENTLIVARNEIKYVADVRKDLGDIREISCHKSEINQVLLNLIVNAAHAIADKGAKGKIEIRTYERDEKVYCEVSDTGTGIPKEHIMQIWDPFFTTKDQGKGTGLGLYISYDIVVNKHGGNIDVRNNEEGGATFTICLPIKQQHKDNNKG